MTIFEPLITDHDTYLDSATPTTVLGSSTSLLCRNSGIADDLSVVLIRFDHELSILQRATSAYIDLQQSSDDDGPPISLTLCLRDWVEGEATWNVYKTGSSWTTAGARGDGNDFSSENEVSGWDPATGNSFITTPNIAAILNESLVLGQSTCTFRLTNTDAVAPTSDRDWLSRDSVGPKPVLRIEGVYYISNGDGFRSSRPLRRTTFAFG